MFGWFKKKPVEPAAPTPPNVVHRWTVDVSYKADGKTAVYSVDRSEWRGDDWGYAHTHGVFDSEEEARAFIEKHAHLPQAFDIVKSYEGPK